jgi:hypothetical protein
VLIAGGAGQAQEPAQPAGPPAPAASATPGATPVPAAAKPTAAAPTIASPVAASPAASAAAVTPPPPAPKPVVSVPVAAPVKPTTTTSAGSAATKPAATAGLPVVITRGTPPFSTAGAWEIRRGDASVGGGCYAMTTYDPDIVLIFGFDLNRASVYLDVGSQRLQPIDPAQSYAMQVQFDKHKPWDARAEVGLNEKVKYLVMRFQGGGIWAEFMNANEMSLHDPGKEEDKDVLRLNLSRSGAAGKEVIRCQNGVNPLGQPAATGTEH